MNLPAATTAATRMGVGTSPSVEELKSFAYFVLENVDLEIGAKVGPNRINRVATNFARTMPNASGYTFFLYLTNEVLRVTEAQRRALLRNPDVGRFITYADPTGEEAIHNVWLERKHPPRTPTPATSGVFHAQNQNGSAL